MLDQTRAQITAEALAVLVYDLVATETQLATLREQYTRLTIDLEGSEIDVTQFHAEMRSFERRMETLSGLVGRLQLATRDIANGVSGLKAKQAEEDWEYLFERIRDRLLGFCRAVKKLFTS